MSKQCSAMRTDGKTPCGRWAIAGGTVCPKHGGQLPNVKEAARKRIEALAPRATEVIEELMEGAVSEPVRLGAARDVLDRAGVGEGKTIKVELTEGAAVDRQIAEMVDRLVGVTRAQSVITALKEQDGWQEDPEQLLSLLEALPDEDAAERALESALCPEDACRHRLDLHVDGEGCPCGCTFGIEEAEVVEETASG